VTSLKTTASKTLKKSGLHGDKAVVLEMLKVSQSEMRSETYSLRVWVQRLTNPSLIEVGDYAMCLGIPHVVATLCVCVCACLYVCMLTRRDINRYDVACCMLYVVR